MDGGAWWAAVHWVPRSLTRLSYFTFTFHFHALEKEMATHSSVLAWRIPGMGESGGLPSMGSHRVGHNWSDLAAAAYHTAVTSRYDCLPIKGVDSIHLGSQHIVWTQYVERMSRDGKSVCHLEWNCLFFSVAHLEEEQRTLCNSYDAVAPSELAPCVHCCHHY